MTLRLYNTLSRTKEEFSPLDPKNVRMYVCGPTVYDFAHIGNARPVIVFDVLFRLLRHLYGEEHVTYVRNITDIDDKINARAAAEGKPIREITELTAKQYHEDVAALGCLAPCFEPRATDHIPEMIAMVADLAAAGFAYEAQGHVLFDVSKKKDYGKLARRSLDEMIAGARVEVAPYKKNPMDFVLWKPSDEKTPGWDSPWGRGRPGWHLECSAMSEALLGETFDIHGGGIDLIFPHHENEIAQSEGAHHGHPLAKVWMHNGFLNVEGEKMSKSLGNFVTINELLSSEKFGKKSWSGEVLRFAMLKTHYRQPIDWTLRGLEESREELAYWANSISSSGGIAGVVEGRAATGNLTLSREVENVLSDDLNTPEMLTYLRELFSKFTKGDVSAGVSLMETCQYLGLLRADRLFIYNPYHVGKGPKLLPQQCKPKLDEIQTAFSNSNPIRVEALKARLAQDGIAVTVHTNGALEYEVTGNAQGVDRLTVQRLIESRNAARKAKNFKEADRIRDELDAQGIVLKDGPDGTTWEVKR